MNNLVKILSSDDGEKREEKKWCLIVNYTGSQTFCEGEFFGFGESGCEFETKTVKRGGITCRKCLRKIKDVKKVKL